MDLDQTQAIYDYEEEEEEKDKQAEAHRKKKEAAHLKVFSQQGFKETVFPVFQGDNFIGRDGKCNITIPIKALSKKHACIEVQRDLHLIHDCESKNRTKKGKLFLKPTIRYELRHGDMLTLGDVRCQYLVEVDTEEDEGDETGSETGSESMLPEVTTEQEQDNDKPIVSEEAANKDDGPREDTVEPVQNYKLPKPSKDEEDAYAADTDSDTDEERPLAAAVMPTVLYSSEDEREAPTRQKATSIPSKWNTSMEGQTLAFGLGTPDNVFQNRESSGSGVSHTGLTGSVPPTLMLTSESDVQSDDKGDLSSDNKQTSPRHPTGTRAVETQPTCQPTLLYDSGSDDGSPIKRPRHPEARVADKHDHPRPCEPTPLYGSESEEGSPIKRPGHPGISNALPVLDESDSEEEIDKALPNSSVVKKIADSSPGKGADDNKAEFKEADATLPYAAAELSSTDDEDETGTTSEDQNTNFKKPMAHEEPTLVFNTEDLRREETKDDEDNMTSDDYGEDSATQPYASDGNFESESEPIPFMGRNEADTSPGKQAGKPPGLESTQAYFVEDNGEEETEERDSDSSDSQPLPMGPTCTAMAGGDDVAATLAYGLEATQAYNVTDNDVDSNSEDERRPSGDDTKTPVNDLPATQAYGVGASDDGNDDDEEDNGQKSDKVKYEEQSGDHKINRGDVNQATVPYGLEATQAYGADHDETDDEDSNYQDNLTGAENQDRANKVTYLAETLRYGGDDSDGDDDAEAHEVTKLFARQENQATLAYGLEATQAYDSDNNGEESAPSGEIEATQAYGIEEPSDEKLQAQVEKSSQRAKTTTRKKVAFVSSFPVSSEASEKGKGQTEAVLTGSSASTTEQIEGLTSGSPEDEMPVSTPATRKGRRGAMRLTIEPGEHEEEEAQETSTRRRGRRGAKVANDQEKDNKKGAATPGRKRGRPAAKSLTAAPEAGKQLSVEVVEETPALKSRRGRKGKMAQAESVSVSETPPSKPTGEGAASEATGSQKSTALVAETPGARRGGRGRGQRSVTVKEVAQVMQEVVETDKEKEEPKDSQSETLVEATPSRGRGRGRGKGKKKQSSVNEAMAEDAPVPVESVIPDEVETKIDTTTPARGKSRGKGRGKKTQPVNNESEGAETAVGSRDKPYSPQSPAVAASRQGRKKRAETSTMELESPKDTSEMLSNPGSREGSLTRKGRGKEKDSRESSEQGPSSDLEVEETPAKKSRKGKEPFVSQSPSLQQGKLTESSIPKVIFTGLVDKQGEKVVTSLGGKLVDDVHSCTHLVTDKVRRTVKFLCGLAGGQIIVQPSWLDACKRAKSFVDSSPFLVKDKDTEKQYKFDLQRSHEIALRQGLLAGYKVHVTKKVKPEPSQMKDIIQSAKGEFLSSMPRGKEERVFVISCEEDRSVCKKSLDAGIPVVSAEVLLTGILRQQLDLEEYKLFAEETSGISQETSNLSGQSKKRREPSAAGSLSSTSEAKVAGSKRRKR